MIERNKPNKFHTQTHYSFSRFKIFIEFYCISLLFILLTRGKIEDVILIGQPSSDNVPVYSMLYM